VCAEPGHARSSANEPNTFKEEKVKRLLLPILLMVGLSGCETMGVGDKSAVIEDRNATPGGMQAGTSPTAAATTATAAGTTTTTSSAGPGVETAPLGVSPTGGQGMDAKPLDGSVESGMRGDDPRRDPASPLSKRSIYFDFDRFVVKDEYRPVIEAHASYLTSHRNSRAVMQGNADSRGSREYNLALGQKRAEAVRRALALLGVQEEQLEAISFGEEKPRAVGDSEQDYAENRRTDIVYGDE
jgi:peptidoglycan-associated lipoprotein